MPKAHQIGAKNYENSIKSQDNFRTTQWRYFWQLQNELRTKPLLKLLCQFELKMKRVSHIDVSLLIFAMQPIIFTKKITLLRILVWKMASITFTPKLFNWLLNSGLISVSAQMNKLFIQFEVHMSLRCILILFDFLEFHSRPLLKK